MMICMIILLIAAVAALAGGCFFYRRKWKQERDRRWDEISESVGWMKMYYNTALDVGAVRHVLYRELRLAYAARDDKQSKLSAILCPLESHLWEDGGYYEKRCRRCGAVKQFFGEPGVTEGCE